MQCHQFLLDLSGNAGVPSQAKIGLREIIKWMSQQAKDHQKNIILTNHYNRGCYLVQTSNDATAEFLRQFKIEINWNGKTIRLPMSPTAQNKPKMWARMYGTCSGDMANVPDSYFDKLLEEACFVVIRPTEKRRHFNSDIGNGQRSALVIRGREHIEREQEWIDDEGNVFRWRLEYDGQPHRCTRGCGVFHADGKCASWERQRQERSREGQQKCYIVSSSLLRLAADTNKTRVDSIPGAKVGHVANHINNDGDIFSKAETVIVHTGANMDLGSVEASKPHLEAQAQELTKVLAPISAASKHVFVVDPVVGPVVEDTPGSDHWAMMRSRMRKVAAKAKAEWITLHGVEWNEEEDLAPDGTHYSKSGTEKVMAAIGKKVSDITGNNVMEGMFIQDRPYAAISRKHYKYGCYRCTRIHEERDCPPLPELANVSVNTDVDSFISADSSGTMSEHADTSDASASPNAAATAAAASKKVLGVGETPVDIDSPDNHVSYRVALRRNISSSNRSPSTGKRNLDSSSEYISEEERQNTKTNSTTHEATTASTRGRGSKRGKK